MVNEPLPRNIRVWGMSCHIAGAIAALIGSVCFTPFIFVILPAIVWNIGRHRHPFIDQQGLSVINFLVSMSIYGTVLSLITAFLLFATCSVLASTSSLYGSDFLMWANFIVLTGFGAFILAQVSIILFAGIKAYQGQAYQYPFTMRFWDNGSVQ
jgi:uncharacterized protein